MGASETERVQKALARAGYGSRRAAEQLVREGRVSINGRIAALGDRVDVKRDRVEVDGAPVAVDPLVRYYAFNKPEGVTTTLRDPHGARSLRDFLPDGPRVFPVGRLDRNSEGLLLLTNDGDLANRVQHPRYSVEKEYLVEVDGDPTPAAVRHLTKGVALDDGMARAVRANVVDRGTGRASLRVVMAEGRKREVRRMLDAIGHPVRRLVRVRVGPILLGRLRPGELRRLSPLEVSALKAVPERSKGEE